MSVLTALVFSLFRTWIQTTSGATGGTAIAETLFGMEGTNRFGKLPFTYYALNFTTASQASRLLVQQLTSIDTIT
jgi:hypothetical protein